MIKGMRKSFFWIVLAILGAGVLSPYLQNESTGEAIRTSRMSDSAAPIPSKTDNSLGSNNPARMRAPCVRPPRPPQKITQAMTICAGTYPYGIIIGADNIQVVCESNTVFDGRQWTSSGAIKDGLTISGKNNVQVTDCSFRNFARHGISVIGSTTPYSSQITLARISSGNNLASGVYIGSNMRDVTVTESGIYQNQADGITLTSQYIGGLGGPSLLFPNTITITNNFISDNVQHGIHLDAFAYYPSSPPENNPLTITGNRMFNNGGDGIRNVGFTSGGDHSYIMNNKIDFSGGSGISIIGAKASTIPYQIGIEADFEYIFSNSIYSNQADGISINSPIVNPQAAWVDIHADFIFANFIRFNMQNGISFTSEVNAPTLTLLQMSTRVILQNDISGNYGRYGIYMQGLGPFANPSIPLSNDFRGTIRCNDIVGNNGNGIQVGQFSSGWVNIDEKNIIEQSSVGIVLDDSSPLANTIYQNYIGYNVVGVSLIGNTTNTQTTYNDFDQNNRIQALDIDANFFTHNWWSDYSPGCVDANLDGWCDVPRPIPSQNSDIQPKARDSWNLKNRGYFIQNTQATGVQIKPSCPVIQLPTNVSINYTGTVGGQGET